MRRRARGPARRRRSRVPGPFSEGLQDPPGGRAPAGRGLPDIQPGGHRAVPPKSRLHRWVCAFGTGLAQPRTINWSSTRPPGPPGAVLRRPARHGHPIPIAGSGGGMRMPRSFWIIAMTEVLARPARPRSPSSATNSRDAGKPGESGPDRVRHRNRRRHRGKCGFISATYFSRVFRTHSGRRGEILREARAGCS